MMIKQAIFSLLLAGASSFAPVSIRPCRRRVLLLEAAHGEHNGGDLALTKFFGLVATVSALSFGGMPAKAQASPNRLVDNVSAYYSSSSVQIADVINTMDMTMPSYGEISDYKASAANAKSLTVEGKKKMGTPTQKVKRVSLAESARMKEAASGASSSSPLANILPSMSKKGAEAKKDPAGYDF